MESYYAHIESEIVTSVEVVTDDFFNKNPQRYKGKWLKVGTTRKLCSKGDIYLPVIDKIVPKKPYPSWILSDDEWLPPEPKPNTLSHWDEKNLKWILA